MKNILIYLILLIVATGCGDDEIKLQKPKEITVKPSKFESFFNGLKGPEFLNYPSQIDSLINSKLLAKFKPNEINITSTRVFYIIINKTEYKDTTKIVHEPYIDSTQFDAYTTLSRNNNEELWVFHIDKNFKCLFETKLKD